MDQDVINLAKAIRQRESGGNFNAVGDASTSKGGYQWQESTWKEHAKKVLGDENAPMTPDNQNAVAYGVIKIWKDQGLNPAQIAAKWNSGSEKGWENKRGVTTINGQKIKYDVPAYVKEVTDTYHKFKGTTVAEATGRDSGPVDYYADPKNQSKPGVWFKSDESDTPLQAGAKTLGNVLPSAFNFGKNVIKALNPVEIIKNIQAIPKEFKALADETGGVKNAFGALTKELPGTAYKTLVPEVARDLIAGDIEGAKEVVTEDPFGQIAPFIFAARGVAGRGKGVADKAATEAQMSDYVANIGENIKNRVPIPNEPVRVNPVDYAMRKTTEAVTEPIKTVFGKAGEGVSRVTRFGTSQATGLSPETITQITENPSAFTKKGMQIAGDRATLGQEIQSALSKRANTLDETGAGYEPIRKAGTPVKVDKGFVENLIKETTGVDIKNGKVTTSGKATIRDATEVRALQNLRDLWDPVFKKGTMTADEFLNFRSDLAKLSKFERQIGKSRDLENVAKIMRSRLNQSYRPQLSGLDVLDEQFASQISELNTLSKGLVDRNGNLTDAAVNRIANATGKGKDALLARLEEITPGITQKIKVLKAVEDIQNASGIKVGAYTRTALVGGGLVLGGPIQAIVNAILTSPELAVPLLRQYGLLKNAKAVKTVIQALKSGTGKINEIPSKVPVIGNPERPKTIFGR